MIEVIRWAASDGAVSSGSSATSEAADIIGVGLLGALNVILFFVISIKLFNEDWRRLLVRGNTVTSFAIEANFTATSAHFILSFRPRNAESFSQHWSNSHSFFVNCKLLWSPVPEDDTDSPKSSFKTEILVDTITSWKVRKSSANSES